MQDPKPRKKLTQAVFLFGNLFGRDERGKTVKCSKVIQRVSRFAFETKNSIYDIEFVPGGETTVPDSIAGYPEPQS